MIVNSFFRNKYFVLLTISINIMFVLLLTSKSRTPGTSIEVVHDFILDEVFSNDINTFEKIKDDYFDARKNLKLSGVGRYLFLNESAPPKRSKEYKMLIWKHGPTIEGRHIYYFGPKKHDPFALCSVNNCALTYEDSALKDVDAVMFQIHSTTGIGELPDPRAPRPAGQRWVFISDESPLNTFHHRSNNWSDYADIFNWSMTYRSESDVPVPHGRTVALGKEMKLDDAMDFTSRFQALVPNAKDKRRDVLVAVLMSNCERDRLTYLAELQKHMTVHVYGACGTDLKLACPGNFMNDCSILDKYMFYLAFANSRCSEYMTEQTYNHGYRKGCIPVVRGVTSEESRLFLPPNSYLNVEDFQTAKDLADRLLYINSTFEENYLKYHDWRRYFNVLVEDGYLGQPSYHYCRLCEALNYNDETPKVYDREELGKFLDPKVTCF